MRKVIGVNGVYNLFVRREGVAGVSEHLMRDRCNLRVVVTIVSLTTCILHGAFVSCSVFE